MDHDSSSGRGARIAQSRKSSSATATAKGTAWALFAIFAVAYGWFFQGGGWNQNSRFDVVRALAESGTLEITAFADNTGDVARVDGAAFSNKPPGLSILAIPAYAAARALQRAAGLEAGAPWVQTANAHLVTWVVAGLPGAALVALLFAHLAAATGERRQALFMAAAFGGGSLVLPYSGVMMNHVLVAAGLFAGWMVLVMDEPSERALLAGGVGLGAAVFTEYLVGPLLALHAVVWFRRRRSLGRRPWLFWAGPVAGVAGLLVLNSWMFGGPLRLSYGAQDALFQDSSLWLGVFEAPDWRRLWWLSFHPYRGLFWSGPLFALALFGPGGGAPERTAFCVAVVAYFLLFNLSFNGWTGGWGIGPRYLIPALPFLLVLAAAPWRRYPLARRVLVALSVVFMTAATTTLVMVPGPNDGPPPEGRAPMVRAVRLALRGEVSTSEQAIFERFPGPSAGSSDDRWDSYNVGELLGLPGLLSVLPVALLVAGGVGFLARRPAPGA